MLLIENLSKTFHYPVLDNLTFQVKKGELIYIHGINGSGKSTLFKVITGILEADGGSIQLSQDCHIGALIENPGFLENESLAYNLRFLASLKNHYDESKIRNLCQLFHLDFDNHAPLKTYSLGMRQKAGIIQAVMEDQNFILLDEPTRGLDQEAIDSFVQLIKTMHQKGKTIIIASHDFLQQLPFDYTYHLKNGILKKD